MKLIIILLLTPVCTLSQNIIKCVVTNSKGVALPYTNIVSMKKNIGTITNEKGEFEIKNIADTDSIKISNVAFIPQVLGVKDLHAYENIILTDSIKKLEDIIIVNFNKFKNLQTIGFSNYSNNGEFKLQPGNQLATFVPNNFQRKGWIKGVYFKIKNFGKCKNDIRIRLLNVDITEFKPGIDILNENIILSTDDLKKTNYIDLTDYKIILPKKGVFIVIEWLYPDNDCIKNTYFSIAANLKMETNLVWLNFRDKHWEHSNRPKLPNGNFMTPNVGLKVAYQ
ncbi:MAG: hypothetical protein ABI267_10200 [Ginsengibacter sp.]